MSPSKTKKPLLSRRSLLRGMGLAPLIWRAAPLHGVPLPGWPSPPKRPEVNAPAQEFGFADVRLTPQYPVGSPLADVLRLVRPGSDEYLSEKYASEIEALLNEWGAALRSTRAVSPALAKLLHPTVEASTFIATETAVRSGGGLEIIRRHFASTLAPGREAFLGAAAAWLGRVAEVETAEFEIVRIEAIASAPMAVTAEIRYAIVSNPGEDRREERIGSWRTEWSHDEAEGWRARKWQATEETLVIVHGPIFIDVTSAALGEAPSYRSQLLHGADYWRTVLDGACGVDVYGNNGVAAGDYNNDGFNDLYICQPAGLPNRLYRNRGDGSFEDVTEKAGVGVLDGTACAIFADFDNRGHQDLLVVCGSGPLLFQNRGDGTFAFKRDAFQFKHPPQGTFTHAAVADYDGDGRLDIYLCLYSYYVGLDQYHYPVPYFDARNGPPNFLLHNEGNASFADKTQTAGLAAENDRYSFAAAWGTTQPKGLPDLYVANDFGRSNLYRNNGDGSFTAVSNQAHIDDAGAGMSASWADCNDDGREDIYAANMWSAAGQRVSAQKQFHDKAPESVREQYRRHARGNSLYRNQGDGKFKNVGQEAGVEMGRWSWCSDFWDFDHDGFADLYVANGYLSAPDKSDLASFFWRQVVAKSPEDATPSPAYERGWQALNELVRADGSWSGYERNVMFANNRDGTFTEVSGAVGLDAREDSRSFALADLDHDGRLEVVLKNRNSPQLRILHNATKELGHSIAFRLQGRRSNRDAIGAAITVEAGSLCQTKYLQAGSGFLAQHSKELFFGLGTYEGAVRAAIRWPSGLSQVCEAVPINHRIEVIEGLTGYSAKTFLGTAAAYSRATTRHLQPEALPSQIETWLIEPLKAPAFSLPDLGGKLHQLDEFLGNSVLLYFWSTSAPLSLQQLSMFHQSSAQLTASKLYVVAINVDDKDQLEAARAAALQDTFSSLKLFSTEETAGIYNLLYRYLFDRRRDMAIPTAFLADSRGFIVKVYQGPVDPQGLLEDLASLPQTAADRQRKALPFAGELYQSGFERNDFTYGVAMFQHGYLEPAEDSFQQVIADKPDYAEGYYNLGTLKLRRKDFKQARSYLEQTLKLKPDYPEAWNNLGMMAAQEGHADEAIRNFQQSLQLRPAYAIALLNLGNVYRRQRAFDKAQTSLMQALTLEPRDAEVHYSLGMLYAQQDQPTKAADFLQKAIELRPDYAEAINNLGVLFVHEQEYSKAEEQFRSCVRIVPGFDQSYLNLARLYAMQGDKAKARQVLDDLLRLQPANDAARQAMTVLE